MRRLSHLAIPLTLGLTLAACGTTTPPATTPQPAASGAVSAGNKSGAPTTTPPPSTAMLEQPLATLTFEPATLTLKAGETAEVKVMLDLKSYASQTYQAEIVFDPKVLEVVDADTNQKDVQVALGMYENPIINKVEEGRVKFAGYSITKGKEALGSGTLVTIKLKGKAAGTSVLSFDRDGSSATKTKVILMGTSTDILLSVGTANVTVQ